MNRSQLRGKRLDEDCKRAYTTRHEYGLRDDRVFCYGLVDKMTDEYIDKCKECGALVYNAEPLQEEVNETGKNQKTKRKDAN